MPHRFTLGILLFLVFCSCGTAEDAASAKQEDPLLEQKMLSDGYARGTITHKYMPDQCDWLVGINSNEAYFQAINLEKEYQKEGLEVWIKYRPIRPVQGACSVQWINIESIQKR